MNADKAAKVCEAIALGSSLRKAAEAQEISHCTFLDWVRDDKDLANQYARAREHGWALLADEVLTISDDGKQDTYFDDEGIERTNQDVIARSRLRVDSRKWMLSKMLPKLYGDKIDLNHSGSVSFSRIESVIVDPNTTASVSSAKTGVLTDSNTTASVRDPAS